MVTRAIGSGTTNGRDVDVTPSPINVPPGCKPSSNEQRGEFGDSEAQARGIQADAAAAAVDQRLAHGAAARRGESSLAHDGGARLLDQISADVLERAAHGERRAIGVACAHLLDQFLPRIDHGAERLWAC